MPKMRSQSREAASLAAHFISVPVGMKPQLRLPIVPVIGGAVRASVTVQDRE
jgi:hypothetical protein